MLLTSGPDGIRVAFWPMPSYVTVAPTATPSESVRRKVDVLIVAAFMARENVAVGCTFVATAVLRSAGVRLITVGATFTVVKLHDTGAARAALSAAFTVVSIRAV